MKPTFILPLLASSLLVACAAPVISSNTVGNGHKDLRPTSLPANCVPNGNDGYRCPQTNHPGSCVYYYSADGRQTGGMCP